MTTPSATDESRTRCAVRPPKPRGQAPAAATASALRARPDQPERWIAHARPVSFEHAAKLVLDAHARDGAREDRFVADLGAFTFGSVDGAMVLAPVVPQGGVAADALPLRALAFSQLCERVGAPPRYVRGLPAELAAANVNFGLARERRGAFLRLAGGEVRAIVGDRYAALDDELVLGVVRDVLERVGFLADARVRATAVGPQTLLRITLPGEGVPVKKGDVIEWGLDLGNSELGLRSVQVTPITYRLVCTNGLRAWTSEAAKRMRHTGDPKRLREQLREAVPVALGEARADVDRWRRATEVRIGNALDELESLRTLGLSQGDVHAVGRALATSADRLPAGSSLDAVAEALATPTTAFDVANAITAVARDRGDVGARLTLEEQGHRYLTRRAA